ncbi:MULTISPECIES: hypothetical protein [Halomonadaceae]|uniref:hypothetical protein n=1 Tax=Halomonadaceae TaxID=28256 RepID=UPI00159A60EF|nr:MULTISPECIES: hypothetical protein [Halomonas]QJQ96094.1 hypothetical protein HIO72_13005 [Halomonas sp. PA5]
MELLIQTLLSFPTIVFTGLLALMLLYWLLVALRLLPIEFFEHDSLRGDHLTSVLVSLGLGGVPASFALSVLLTLGAVLCLAIELLVLRFLPLGFFRVPLGFLVLWAALAVAAPLSVSLCHAAQRSFHRWRRVCTRCLLGEAVVVHERTGSDGLCQASLVEDPEVVVTLHCKQQDCPAVGERRILVKYLAGEGTYRSVAADAFMNARERLSRLPMPHRQQHGHG